MGENRTARSRRVWDELAPRYDRSMRWAERRLIADGRPWVCSRASGEVLEIGFGTGANLPFYPPGIRLTGVDLSPRMLAVGRQRAHELGVAVELVEADVQALPFDDASFDTVVGTLVLCAVADERATIAQLHRVLRPGGRLLLLDHVASTWFPLRVGQRLVELVTIRTANEHFTRRPLTMLPRQGFELVESHRSRAGIVERVHARRT